MYWRAAKQSAHSLSAHSLLFSFTLLLLFKLDHTVSYSWWIIFSPLWLFHVVVARNRFSLPAPSTLHDRNWAPCHAVAATPLLVAFELLLCIYLESIFAYGYAAVNLKIVFLPLLTFELTILIDNFRMCRALVPEDEGSINDEIIWETLPHFWVAITMVFLVAATTFTLLKLCGDVSSLGWWDLFLNFGIAECFSFLVCTKWSNPMINGNYLSYSSSMSVRSLGWNSSYLLSSEMDEMNDGMCTLENIGGHIMKIPAVVFQVLLCMHLAGTPRSARDIPLPVIFSPLLILQGAGVLFFISKLVETIVFLWRGGDCTGWYLIFSSRVNDFFGFLHHGSRLLGWWSTEEGSQEERARFYLGGSVGYNTFRGYAPETVKKMPKKDLAKEVCRLQAALNEQAEISTCSQQKYERLQNEKVLCRVCFSLDINIVLLPCRHHIVCSMCAEKCKRCPICRVPIEKRLLIYDV